MEDDGAAAPPAAPAAAAAMDQQPHGADDGGAGQQQQQQEQQEQDPRREVGCMENGCDHYRRRCKLVAPCCGEVFWCRHCHNAVKDDTEQDHGRRHRLDRKQVAEVVCVLCGSRQPVAPACSDCGVSFGRYCCLTCKFFDDDTSKGQFHCGDCGICRVGGRPNFFHCSTCNCCYSIAMQDDHVCVSNSMHQNCPVCFEYLFDSIRPISVLACGHTIHQSCHRDLLEHNSLTCPVCLKCFLGEDQQAALWRHLDEQVATTPMPEEYRDLKVTVLCNDCSARTETTFHVVGHKCGRCGGYNTRRVAGDTTPAAAAAAAAATAAQQQQQPAAGETGEQQQQQQQG